MKSICKLAVLTLVSAASLALAGNAFATQKLEVSQTSGSVTIKVSQAQTDAQPAKITIYVPAGYQLNTSQTAGTVIGKTSGQVFARDLSIPLPLEGDVVVDSPSNHLTDPCSPGTHQAVWILKLAVAGQTIQLPVYVDPTAGAEGALGSAKLVVCLGPSDVPSGTPGRSPNGAQLLDATFTVNSVLTPPSGATRWISFTTPYAAGNGRPNAAGTVETRSFVGPGAVTLKSKIVNKKKKLVRLSGTVSQSGVGVATKVRIFVNNKARFSTNSKANGEYQISLKNTKKGVRTTVFQARVSVAARDTTATGCADPTQAPIPCVSATAGSFSAVSPKVKVRL